MTVHHVTLGSTESASWSLKLDHGPGGVVVIDSQQYHLAWIEATFPIVTMSLTLILPSCRSWANVSSLERREWGEEK